MDIRIVCIAVCLTLVPAVVMAKSNVNLYGSLRVGINNDNKGNEYNLADEVSHIGIRGSLDMGNGWQGIFRVESRLFIDDGTYAGASEKYARLAWVGIKSDWGTVKAGRQWVPDFFWLGALGNGGFNHKRFGVWRQLAHRMPNAISYTTPKLGRFQFAGTAVMGGSGGRIGGQLGGPGFDANGRSLDIYRLAGQWNGYGVHAAAAYTEIPASEKLTPARKANIVQALVSYTWRKTINLYGAYQNERNLVADDVDVRTVDVGAQYFLGKHSARVKYTRNEYRGGRDGSASGVAVGYQYRMTQQVRFWVEHMFSNSDYNVTFKYGMNNVDATSVGMRYDF